jgi:hypothetical protein
MASYQVIYGGASHENMHSDARFMDSMRDDGQVYFKNKRGGNCEQAAPKCMTSEGLSYVIIVVVLILILVLILLFTADTFQKSRISSQAAHQGVKAYLFLCFLGWLASSATSQSLHTNIPQQPLEKVILVREGHPGSGHYGGRNIFPARLRCAMHAQRGARDILVLSVA